ncbi:hypothetical protein KP509_28G057300 [Ceratopteris richardii]|uniref:Uncharacterized protein n=1 Tax=Ceratopteris richardii TaxID=49495 RepID=A0A8T2REZ2_CERRI|nr:hypothetical protein KP509_28G057300 [Ceratopteris richardii]
MHKATEKEKISIANMKIHMVLGDKACADWFISIAYFYVRCAWLKELIVKHKSCIWRTKTRSNHVEWARAISTSSIKCVFSVFLEDLSTHGLFG